MTDKIKQRLADAGLMVKPLVWEYHPAGKLAANNMGGSYIIDTRGVSPTFLKWPGGYGPSSGDVDWLMAHAQADHERRVYDAMKAKEKET